MLIDLLGSISFERCVHSSVLADKIQVGDKLRSIDDIDVRNLTAMGVSKLIKISSGNPRKLRFMRRKILSRG